VQVFVPRIVTQGHDSDFRIPLGIPRAFGGNGSSSSAGPRAAPGDFSRAAIHSGHIREEFDRNELGGLRGSRSSRGCWLITTQSKLSVGRKFCEDDLAQSPAYLSTSLRCAQIREFVCQVVDLFLRVVVLHELVLTPVGKVHEEHTGGRVGRCWG
jgi:hypothetical protein